MALFLVIAAVLGLAAGRLVNYLSDVLPVYRKPVPFICLTCRSLLDWKEALFYRPCSICQRRVTRRELAVQIIYPFLFIWLVLFPPVRLPFWMAAVLLVYFGVVAVIDLEHRLILNQVSIVGALLALATGIWIHGWKTTLIGGASGYGIMLVLYLLGGVFAWVVGRFQGAPLEEVPLGYGDVNLSGIIGLLLGWPGITLGLMFAILAGGVASGIHIAVQRLAKRYQVFTAIPYAPFLILGLLILLYRP